MKKIILEFFFSAFRKITVRGFVNLLIKKFWPNDKTAVFSLISVNKTTGACPKYSEVKREFID